MQLFFQDYLVIAIYFGFMIAVGVVYRRICRNSSDYFRGGGSMSWWLVGSSNWMAGFSAWTFVACGGRIYKYGTMIAIGTILSGLAGIALAFSVIKWFRRMRVITPVDTIYRRYGRSTEQFYAWYSLISNFLFAGVALYILAVFFSPLLKLPVNTMIVILGAAVVFLSVTGGAWAVAASDFVQALVLTTIVIIAAWLVLRSPEVGGVSGLLDKVPDYQFDWSIFSREPVMITFLISSLLVAIASQLDMNINAGRYLCARSDKDAVKAALFVGIGSLVGPLFFFLPPLAASFAIPDLLSEYSQLKNPEEAAYLAMTARVLPKGMLGMMVCGIFSATLSSLNVGLNRNSGIIVENIYKPLFNPNASDSNRLLMGKIVTLLLGAAMIGGGMLYSKLADFSLYQWTQHFNSLIFFPSFTPLCLGLFFRRTPKWTPLIAIGLLFGISCAMKFGIDYQAFSIAQGWGELTQLELLDFSSSIIAIVNIAAGIIIFAVAQLLYKRFPLASTDSERVASLFNDMKQPVLADPEESRHADLSQYKLLGGLALSYGLVLIGCMLLPNDALGRICFLFSGLFVGGIGLVLCIAYRRLKNKTKIMEK